MLDNVKFTNPETAAKAGEKWYKTKIVNPDTGEESEQLRPIFIIDRHDGNLEVSAAYLYKFFQLTEKCIMLRNGALDTEIRYIFRDGVYKTANDSDIMRILMNSVEKYRIKLLNPAVIKQALELFDYQCEHFLHDAMNADEDVINFQNGLLDIKSLELSKHTDELMTTIQIPCKWRGEAAETPFFNDFLKNLTSGDQKTQKLILEYIGAIVSNVQGWRYKKAMFLYGAGNTGKSTLINLITRILGSENVAERDLKSLNERFGKTAAYNKRLIYSNDLSYMKVEENAIFKNLTGGDAIAVEFKNKEPFDFKFKGFLLYGMNELPRFGGDKGEHVYNRIIIVKCENVVPKDVLDPHFPAKLFSEREGIIYKCVTAFRETVFNNYRFSVTQSAIDELTAYKRENSYPVEFWQTYMEPLKPGDAPHDTSERVYSNFRYWCTRQGFNHIPSFPEFRKDVSNFLNIPWNELVKRVIKGKILINYRINAEWKNTYDD
jgi:P4 family phage/plasmid primase-like protien